MAGNREKDFLKYWLPVIIYAMLIFWGSSLEEPFKIDIEIIGLDKVLHILEYTVLGFLLARLIAASSPGIPAGKVVLITFIISTFYGLTDEFHQYFVPGRGVSILDLAADAVGSLLGTLGFIIFIKKHKAMIHG